MLKKEISKLLHDLGIPSSMKGYWYLREIIFSLIFQNMHDFKLNKEYKKIAKKNNTSSFCVEKDIRYVIEKGWNRVNWQVMNQMFGNSYVNDRPTNKEFIITLVDYLKSYNKGEFL